MRKSFVFGIFALVGLGSFAVLGSSPADFKGTLESVVRLNFALLSSKDAMPKEEGNHEKLREVIRAAERSRFSVGELRAVERKATETEISEEMLWRIVFDFKKKIEEKGAEANSKGERGTLYSSYLIRQGPLSANNDQILKEKSQQYFLEVNPLIQNARKIREDYDKSKDQSLLDQIKDLQKQRDEITLRLRDEIKQAYGEEAFNGFVNFLNTDFTSGMKSFQPNIPEGFSNVPVPVGETLILWDETAYPTLISGYTYLYLDLFFSDFQSWNPYIESYLVNDSTASIYEFGWSEGYRDWVPAEVLHSIFVSNVGQTYCTFADGWALLYDGPFVVDEYYYGQPFDCHTVNAPPPTPTPTPPPPTPTPSPNPCDPANFGECQTPTPTPTPTVSITPIEVVEKFGTKDITITIRDNGSGTTRFSLCRTTGPGTQCSTAGSGDATFEDGTREFVVNSNAMNQIIKVKGVTESSQLNNIRIEARMNGSSTVSAQDDFTVAVITSLEFERYDTTYIDLDDNPGNGQPNTRIGKRIYPDKKDVADVSTGTADRSLVKVKANVLPSTADLKVYFGSFDMDDPSATGSPIDTTGPDGGDNNGPVKAGDFVITTGNNCEDEIPNEVSKIECPTASDGSATAVFKTTMQSGDNFSIAASVDRAYRNGITVNSADGSKLRNQENKEIVISGGVNPDSIPGLRTEILTVWRKLHIEIDSMGPVSGNFVEGTFTENRKVGTGTKTLDVNVSTPLEPNRFENGRMVINGRSYLVIDATASATANTVDSVTIRVLTVFNITPTTTFRLYDDDDMDDTDGGFTTLKGDQGDDVPEPDISFLNESDDAALNYLASAYIRPAYDLAQSHENVPFVANIEATTLGQLDPYLSAPNFDNVGGEALSNFWTIYLLGAYQLTLASDGDPRSLGTGINFGATYGASNVSDAPPHSTNGFGSIVFAEMGRPNEYPADHASRPVSRAHTTVHEVGHLFGCIHGEGGLMEVTQIRTGGTFSETSLSWIRKAEHP